VAFIVSTGRLAATTWTPIVRRATIATRSSTPAIVSAKGALMFVDLQKTLGEEKVFAALRKYYQANVYEIAQLEDLRIALVAEAPVEQRRMIGRTFTRWLTAKRGDEDIATPDSGAGRNPGYHH
jgi:aminopeptidase N